MTPGLGKNSGYHLRHTTLLNGYISRNVAQYPKAESLVNADDHLGICGHVWLDIHTYNPRWSCKNMGRPKAVFLLLPR